MRKCTCEGERNDYTGRLVGARDRRFPDRRYTGRGFIPASLFALRMGVWPQTKCSCHFGRATGFAGQSMAGGKQAQIRNHVLPVLTLMYFYTGRWVEGLVRCFAHYLKRHLNYVRKTSLQVVQSVATSISELMLQI